MYAESKSDRCSGRAARIQQLDARVLHAKLSAGILCLILFCAVCIGKSYRFARPVGEVLVNPRSAHRVAEQPPVPIVNSYKSVYI